MLMAFVMAFRYRMEFYPLFVFLVLIGAFGTKPEIAAPRPRSATGLVLLASFGIILSHLVLGAYKLSPWGNLDPSQDLLQIYQTGLGNFLARRLQLLRSEAKQVVEVWRKRGLRVERCGG